jgi:hypothetical protein
MVANHPMYQFKNDRLVEYVDVTKTDIGLSNVDNTADANKNVLTATKFSSARTIQLTGDATGSASSDGTNGWSITTSVNHADTATKLAAAKTITLSGSVTGSTTFDGSGNVTIATTTNHTHNYAGSSSAGGSAKAVAGVAGSVNKDRHVWFSDSVTETQRNYDDDFKYNPSTNVLTVGSITGNAATATKATQDGSGNTITSYYVTLSTAQTVSGAKTFSGATAITNTTASTNKTTGALKVSGGVGVAGQMSADKVMVGDNVVLQFNTSTNSLDFIFN